MSAEPREGFVAVGWIRGPRGVRGELKVTPLTDFAHRFAAGARVWVAGKTHTVQEAREQRGAILLLLDGVESRSQAEAFRSHLLEVPEADLPSLPEDEYYRYQIVGMEVVDGEGRPLGRVEEVIDTGANDVFVVRDDEGELLIPAIDAVVKDVDVRRRRMTVELIPGLERRPAKRRRP